MLTRNKSHFGSSLSNKTNWQKYSAENCRICLDDGEIPIFGANDMSDDVTEFGQIIIRKNDNLPQYLCDGCHKLLEAAILFRKTAKQTDELLNTPDTDSATENSDCKLEDETFIKKEYLEFNYTSGSESESYNLDRVKLEYENEASNHNPTISEAYSEDSNDSKDFQTNLLHVKREEDGSITEADSETIMIIVSDKEKQKLEENEEEETNEDDNSCIDSDNDEEITENEKSLTKVLSHQRECEVCHTIVPKTTYMKHLKEHRLKYKAKYEKMYGKIECEICGKRISKSYIKVHKKMHGTAEEKAERLVECKICNKMFNMYYYKIHVLKMHQSKSKTKRETIQIQDKRIKSPPPLKYNECPVCDRHIKESEFKLHLEKHDGPLRRYICDKCGKVFKYPSAFKTHCLTHGSELKYKCQFCPYRGLHQGLLKIHVRTHTGDYNYNCTECPAKFITKSNLSKHLMRHKGLYSYKCADCGKGFYAKRDLEKHAKTIHMSLKNHICEVCGKAFGHRDNLLSHELKVHKRDKIPKGRIPSYLKVELMNQE